MSLCYEKLCAAYPEGEVRLYDSIPSTNTEARTLCAAGVSRALLIADTQTAGRGRMGRAFHSPLGAGLYMTLLLPVNRDLDPATLTLTAAVAVREAVSGLGVDARIKWVNDIFVGTRKLSGILAEGVISQETGKITHAILGIGVNCTSAAFPKELKNVVTCLQNEGAENLNRTDLAISILNSLRARFVLPFSEILSEYRRYMLYLGQKIMLNDFTSERPVTLLDLTEDGGILVENADGTLTAHRTAEVRIQQIS